MGDYRATSEVLPGEVVLVRVSGSLDATAYDAFQKVFDSHRSENRSRFIADLTAVEYICSSAITVLTSTLTAAQQAGGNLVIAGMSKPVRQVFEVLCIVELFPQAETVEAARARFG
jgi:anti-anti-sigma factor